MAKGYFIRKGDKTSCGGEVLEGDTRITMFGFAHARAGDPVSCGKDNKTYEIEGGVSFMDSHGRLVAGSLDSASSCPCKATLEPSIFITSYISKVTSAPPAARAVPATRDSSCPRPSGHGSPVRVGFGSENCHADLQRTAGNGLREPLARLPATGRKRRGAGRQADYRPESTQQGDQCRLRAAVAPR